MVPTVLFAAWQWLVPHPYASKPDPDALAEVKFTQLIRDESFYWLTVKIHITDPSRHDLSKGLALTVDGGRELQPTSIEIEADGEVTPTGDGISVPETLGLTAKFWLQEKDFAGPIQLRINDGALTIREGSGLPGLENHSETVKKNSDW